MPQKNKLCMHSSNGNFVDMNLSDLLKIASNSCLLEGLCGSAKGWFLSKWQEIYKKPVLVVVEGPHEAERWADDLETFGKNSVSIFPEWEEGRLGAIEAAGERWSILENPPVFLIVTADTVSAKVVPQKILSKIRIRLDENARISRDNLLRWLVENGYERAEVVDTIGEFSHRGGIVDIFPPNSETPIRIEYAGDDIESVRSFDQLTQCSVPGGKLPEYLYPVNEAEIYARYKNELVGIENYLTEGAAVVFCNVGEERAFAVNIKHRIFLAELITDKGGPHLVAKSLEYLSIPKRTPDMLEMAKERIFKEIKNWLDNEYGIFIWCNNEGEEKRLQEWLREKQLADRKGLRVGIGRISGGFVCPEEKLVFISDEEIFARYKVRLFRRRFKKHGIPIKEWTELKEGDYVVHADHGIGKYLGIKKEDGRDMLVILYADKAKLYVPMNNVPLVERYMGVGGRPPQLDQLGGKKWLKTKLKVEKDLVDIASELLEVQAKRQALKGCAFPKDHLWQREMEDAFIYEETPDQMTAIGDVKRDMESPVPMDRLICGDVGYGKTEVAVRAAFKAVMDGKQVAVLVPTTILAQQHYRTFSDRLADYPVSVEMLSRFRNEKEQKGIVSFLAEGKIDIIVGTHRIVQPDIKFKDLGLVVIDEEQRFGVRHKEWLKKIRELVDVITMTATPIPRTLYMAMTGIRDMSVINTPPKERMAVETILAEYDEKVIRHAIMRELNREGQAYFLHNRVESIERTAERLQKLVPEARFLVGHGQMDEETLAYVMEEFVQGKADVLVCTTIIQSGLDIPNVNTIIIDHADAFGLADLYQLRGRVGRYKNQAFAYLLVPPWKALTGIAKKRLKAIQDFSQLGAGFKIALQDLEIRGAGNILGQQQHGNIHAVGFDMYCKLLHRNILKLQGHPVEEHYEVVLDIGIEGFIPIEYIESDNVRIDFYKKIAGALEIKELDAVEKEMKDRFGDIPEDAIRLFSVMKIKLYAVKKKIKQIIAANNKISFHWLNGKVIVEDAPKDKLKWIMEKVCVKM